MKKVVLFSFITVLLGCSVFLYLPGAEAQTSTGFDDPQINNPVTTFALQPDGKILVGGGFTIVNGEPYTKIVRLNLDGTVDSTFTNPNFNGQLVLSIAVQADGKILAAGDFSTSGTQPREELVRLNSDGTLDESFSPDIGNAVYTVAVQTDGKILIGGDFETVDGNTRTKIARLNSDGTIDISFPNLNVNGTKNFSSARVHEIKLQSDGKILVGGNFASIGGEDRRAFARLNTNGTIDSSFTDPKLTDGTGVTVNSTQTATIVNSIGIQADGKIVVGGAIGKVNGQTRDNIARLNTDGSLDMTFQNPVIENGFANSFLNDLEIQPDGKVIIGGYFATVGGQPREDMARLNSDGTLDQSFENTNVSDGYILGIKLQPDGRILIGGFFRVVAGRRRVNITRLASNGLLDVPEPQTFVVTKTDDTNDGVCDADCSLREAIEATNIATSDDTIEFDATQFTGINQITLTQGQLSICNEGSLDFNGTGQNNLIISGNNETRIMRVFSNGFLRLNDVTLLDGRTSPGFSPGEAVSETVSSGPPPCPGSSSSVGGAGLESQGTVFINNSRISGNHSNASGGGLANVRGDMTITNSIIENNTATDYAGIINLGLDNIPLGNLKIINSRVTGNIASGTQTSIGGGIGSVTNATVEIINSSIDNNTGTTRGGGIYNNRSNLIVTNSTFSGNDADFGGGIYIDGGIVSLTNATIAFNEATTIGGGINNTDPSPPQGILNSKNSIISNNTAPTSPDFSGSMNSQGYNLIGNSSGNSIVGDTTGNILNVDPMLNPQLMSINSTPVHFLEVGSPAIDKGKSSDSNEDQRGKARPFDFPSIANATGGDGSDIGAFERQENESAGNNTRFDLDGDGKTDIGIWRPAPGEWWYLRSSDNSAQAFQFGQSTDVIVPADYTGDGATDIAFFRDGQWFVLRSEDSSFYAFPFGQSGDIPAPGDFDGDGKDDPAVFRPSSGTWFYIKSSDGQVVITAFGADGDKPIVEDYDGDGTDDLAVFRPSVAEWYLLRSTAGFIGFSFGSPGNTTPVPADYTGDGKTDIAFFNPNAPGGQINWFVLRSEDESFYAFPFGAPGDIPVTGDYDGDGTADPAIFRPSDNNWYLQQTTDGFEQVQFGVPNDKPIPAAYIP